MAFSLKHLMFVMLVAATGLAALLNADRIFVAELVNLCTLTIIVITGYGAWTSEGARRAFRIGFVGWSVVYFLVAMILLRYRFAYLTDAILRLGWRMLQPSRITALDGTGEAQGAWINRFIEIG